ncbi:MAG: hypothetical protein ACRD3T_04600 [Terriglobia bacterium]
MRERTAPIVVRRKGARGELAVPPEEKIQILVYLTQDPDPEISRQAMETLGQARQEELLAVLQNPATPVAVLDFAANHLIETREELLDALLRNPAFHSSTSSAEAEGAAVVQDPTVETPEPGSVTSPPPERGSEPAGMLERESVRQKLSKLSPAEKIKRALMGSQEERLILIRDSNKSVARAVVQSPKLTDAEVEAIASMRNVMEEVLRRFAQNRTHLKHYGVVRALVGNPRVPIDITLPLISRLNDRDLKMLALDRNLAEVVRSMAAKNLRDRQVTRGPALPRKH